ncbi:MAG: cadherin-like domain-containing protein [Sneathiella sp.]
MAVSKSNAVATAAEGVIVEVEAGQNVQLDVVSADLVVFSQDASDLVVTSIADGSSVVLQGFFSQAGTELPPQLTLSDGTVLSAAEVTGLVEEFDPDLVVPAAGGPAAGATPNGGGAGFSSFDDDGIGDGIGISGLLDPTELAFSDEVIDEEVGLLPDGAGGDVTDGSVVAVDDIVITNSDTPIFIPEYGLLSNDTDPEGDVISVDGVTAPAARDEADYVNVTPSGIPGTDIEFDYTATDGTNTDTAGVDVEYQLIGGGLGLLGNERNEIAIGSLGADTIVGGGGDDTIAGGAGDDRLFGGTGNANDDGGRNVFHYYGSDTAGVGGAGGTDGNDIIFDFDVSNDVINLDALFDALGGGNAEARADLVNLVSDGTDTVVTVDGEAGFSITLDNVDLGSSDGTLNAADLLANAGISVSDES